MKRFFWPLLFVLACAVPAFAQNPNIINPSPQTVTTATNSSCVTRVGAAVWDVTAVKSIGLQVSNTFSGTLTFKTTTDGVNWNTTTLMDLSDGSADTTTTGTGQWSIVNTGIQGICAQATAWASGTATITALFGNGGSFIVPVGAIAPSSANYWIATANAALPNAKVLGALGTGLVFNTTTTGTPTVVVCATAGTVLVGGAPPTCDANPVVTSISAGSGTAPTGGAVRLPNDNFVVGRSTGGTNRNLIGLNSSNLVRIDDAGVGSSFGGVIQNSDGSITAPSFTFGSAATLGLYRVGSYVGFANASTLEFMAGGSGAFLSSDASLGWSNTAGNANASTDTLVSRSSAKVLALGPTTGVRLSWATADTLNVQSFAGGAGNLVAAGTITFAGLASASGVRYVCANTTGVLDGQAAACVGTEATIAQYAKDGYVVMTRDEYADFQTMRSQFKFSGIVR